MQNLITHTIESLQGKHPFSARRSPEWPRVRAEHLKSHPTCEVCGSTDKIEVHHIQPFHLHPERELDPTNLITLCESGHEGANCHLHYGHLGNFKSFNVSVVEDAGVWKKKIASRP